MMKFVCIALVILFLPILFIILLKLLACLIFVVMAPWLFTIDKFFGTNYLDMFFKDMNDKK